MKNPSDKYPIVYVEWADAYGSNEWIKDEDIEDEHLRKDRFTCYNIGWLLRKTNKVYVIAALMNTADDQWGHVQTIPKGWAIIKVLAPPRKKM